MNIYSKYGDKVIFDQPNNGYNCDQERAKEHLVVGNIYTIDHTNVHPFSTSVSLIEVPGVLFNSVLFSDYKTKTYVEVAKEFESLHFPDKEHVLDPKKLREANEKFEKYLNEVGWTYDEWLKEQFKRLKI